MILRVLLGIIFCLFVHAANLFGQNIMLRLDTTRPTFAGTSLFCGERSCGMPAGEQQKDGTFGADRIGVRVERAKSGFLFSIDTNGRNGLLDEKKISLTNEGKAIVKLKRRVSPQRTIYLPYEISHERDEKNGEDDFAIRAHYTMTGKFLSAKCTLDVALSDMDANGKADLDDGERGSNFQIDRNRDGKYWGREEFSRTNEIVELCGQNHLVSNISFSRLTLKPTDLKLAKISEKVVNFSFDLINGSKITSESMAGRSYVMDFWASWCKPCVENLSHISKLRTDVGNSVDVFSINVDVASQKRKAEQIIKQYDLGEFSSIRGRGNNDPIWKAFGSANLNRLSIPLYVLVDKDGMVRYADNGGKNLDELRKAIAEISNRR